jgi:hypothetical protein
MKINIAKRKVRDKDMWSLTVNYKGKRTAQQDEKIAMSKVN